MRFKIKATLLALIAVCALTGTAAASASAHEFIASNAGALSGRAETGTPELALTGSGGSYHVTCDGGTVTGKAKAGSQATLIETVQDEECSFIGWTVKPTPMELELNANGTVKLLNTVKFENKAIKCAWSISPVTSPSTVTFTDNLESFNANFSGVELPVEETGEGNLCLGKGKQTGKLTTSLTAKLGTAKGETIQWK